MKHNLRWWWAHRADFQPTTYFTSELRPDATPNIRHTASVTTLCAEQREAFGCWLDRCLFMNSVDTKTEYHKRRWTARPAFMSIQMTQNESKVRSIQFITGLFFSVLLSAVKAKIWVFFIYLSFVDVSTMCLNLFQSQNSTYAGVSWRKSHYSSAAPPRHTHITTSKVTL